MGREAAILPHELPSGKHLVAGHQATHHQRQRPMMIRQDNLKPVPRHPPVILVSLRGPTVVGAQQCPRGIVKGGIGPTRVIACVEAPQAVEHCHRDAVLFHVEDLR
jgi:hypothetical protein